jgi:hypothetical protein
MSIEAMKQALKALEQVKPLYDRHHAITALRQAIAEAEKQEPVECMCGICKLGKREWAGLTDEEIVTISIDCAFDNLTDIYFARAIEAKLKEKNFT